MNFDKCGTFKDRLRAHTLFINLTQLTTLGLYGGVILLWLRSSQLIGAKKVWFFISSYKQGGGQLHM